MCTPQIAEGTTPQKFLELLAARDFERLAATLASDAHARLLLPYGLEEDAGRDAIVHRIESWFGSASVFDLTSSSEEMVGLLHRLSWRFSVVRDGSSHEVIEQLAYLDLGPHGIEQIDLLSVPDSKWSRASWRARCRSSRPAPWAAPTAWPRSSGAGSPMCR